MKKFTFLIVILLAFAGFTKAQVIEDFEHIKLNVMFGGAEDNSTMIVVPNPDTENAVNPSSHVVKFHRSQHGVPWGGFWSRLETAVDVSELKYVYVDVWKTRISPLKFKLEDGPSGNLEIVSMTPQTKVNEWETIVFDFSSKDGTWNVIAFMPDFADPVGLDEDIVIYFDNIRLGGPPASKDAHASMIEDFEHIKLNWFAAGDDAYMYVVPNPDFENEVNPSNHVVEFNRGKGDPWGGFWTPLASPVDLSENSYFYVDVWKPMISRVVFKLEGSVTGADNVELPSMKPQSKVEEWETLVFDFSAVEGQWNTITFFPDFPESGDDVSADYVLMYFDNIRQGGPPDDEPGEFREVDFVWSDFSIAGETNVGGFRSAIGGTVATDMPEMGIDGGTMVSLEYEVSESRLSTGYNLWAWSPGAEYANVSEYTHLVLNIRAAAPVTNAKITLRDNASFSGGNGISHQFFDIGTEWHQVILPVNEFVLEEGNAHPDLSILQLVLLTFEYEHTTPHTGTVHLDLVGFVADEPTSVTEPGQGHAMSFQVYPNPARDLFAVRAESGAHISLIDITGNLISHQVAISDVTTFDVSGLAKGIYLIRVLHNNTIGTQKLLVH